MRVKPRAAPISALLSWPRSFRSLAKLCKPVCTAWPKLAKGLLDGAGAATGAGFGAGAATGLGAGLGAAGVALAVGSTYSLVTKPVVGSLLSTYGMVSYLS